MSKRFCIVCGSTEGTPIAGGRREWFWRSTIGASGPFCMTLCRDRWDAWAPERQAAALLGGEFAWVFGQLQRSYTAESPAYGLEFEAIDPVYCPSQDSYPDIQERDGKEVEVWPIAGLARTRVNLTEIEDQP